MVLIKMLKRKYSKQTGSHQFVLKNEGEIFPFSSELIENGEWIEGKDFLIMKAEKTSLAAMYKDKEFIKESLNLKSFHFEETVKTKKNKGAGK